MLQMVPNFGHLLPSDVEPFVVKDPLSVAVAMISGGRGATQSAGASCLDSEFPSTSSCDCHRRGGLERVAALESHVVFPSLGKPESFVVLCERVWPAHITESSSRHSSQ